MSSCPSTRPTIRSVATTQRIPDRVLFEKLVQILVFGCASYERIADGSCSESTLLRRRRREEWIELGVMERLIREISLEAYDRLIGLELADLAVDGGASPTRPLAVGRKREKAR